jgi:hypothetical protein
MPFQKAQPITPHALQRHDPAFAEFKTIERKLAALMGTKQQSKENLPDDCERNKECSRLYQLLPVFVLSNEKPIKSFCSRKPGCLELLL